MTKDKTVTMSRELIDRMVNALDDEGWHTLADEAAQVLAAHIVEADGMGEAMAWALLNGNGQVRDLTARWDVAKHWDGLVETLYASQPAPVSVDERAEFERWAIQEAQSRSYSYMSCVLKRDGECYSTSWVDSMWMGWQARACLDKVKELNQ